MHLPYVLKSLGILLFFVVQRSCFCSVLNYTTASPTVKEISLADHKSCASRCLQEINVVTPSLSVDYYDCMRNCTSNHQWSIRENACSKKPIQSIIDRNAPSTCPPPSKDISITETYRKITSNGQNHGYLYIKWKPCDVGIEHLKGFYITIQAVHMFYPECRNISLTRPLNRSDESMYFSLISHHRVKDDTTYTVKIRALPLNKVRDDSPERVITSTCELLNPNSCFCDSSSPLPAPNVTVDGYKVTVSSRPAISCFGIIEYDAVLGFARRNGFLDEYISTGLMKYSLTNQSMLSHTFNRVYNNTEANYYKAKIIMLRNGIHQSTNSTLFQIKPWIPPVPDVEVSSPGHVVVSFHVASDGYEIEMYSVQLLKLTIINDVILGSKTILTNNLSANTAKDGILKKAFFNIEPASYSVQIKEVREPSLESYFNRPKWGQPKMFVVAPATDLGLILGTTVPILVVFFVFNFIFCLYLWKRDKCKVIRSYLPGYFVQWLDSQTHELRRRTVLIVWQSDFRSAKLEEKHEENIRHFASYLSTVCGLEVIIDLFDVPKMTEAMSEWVAESCKRAEFVIFICPHFDHRNEVITRQALTGNFQRMYRYLESRLGVEDKSRFITTLLPYSDSKSSSSAEYLMEMTRVFTLMDEIEDLYFHIQECSKVDVRGRHKVQNVNKKDYMNTREGRALVKGMRDFQACLSSVVFEEETSLSSVDSNGRMEGNKGVRIILSAFEENSESTGSTNDLRSSDASLDETEHLMKHHLSISQPPSTDIPIYRQRDPVQPPPPLVDNPEEQIFLINKMSRHPPQSCPYHDLPHTQPYNIVQSYTNSGLSNGAYGSSCSRSFRNSGSFDKNISNPDTSFLRLSTRSLHALNLQDGDEPRKCDDMSRLLLSRSLECVYIASSATDSGFHSPRS